MFTETNSGSAKFVISEVENWTSKKRYYWYLTSLKTTTIKLSEDLSNYDAWNSPSHIIKYSINSDFNFKWKFQSNTEKKRARDRK